MIQNLNSLVRQRDEQFGRMNQSQTQKKSDEISEEALKLFFDYIKASNDQLTGICDAILENQKVFELKLNEISTILNSIKK